MIINFDGRNRKHFLLFFNYKVTFLTSFHPGGKCLSVFKKSWNGSGVDVKSRAYQAEGLGSNLRLCN